MLARLKDGSIIHFDSFRWDGSTLTGHNANLGEVRLPAAVLDELIFNPPPMRMPHPLVEGTRKPVEIVFHR